MHRRARLKPNVSSLRVEQAMDSQTNDGLSPRNRQRGQIGEYMTKRSKDISFDPATKKFATSMPPPVRPSAASVIDHVANSVSGVQTYGSNFNDGVLSRNFHTAHGRRSQSSGAKGFDSVSDDPEYPTNPTALAMRKRRSKPLQSNREEQTNSGPNEFCEPGIANVDLPEDSSRPVCKRKKNLGPEDAKSDIAESALTDQNALTEADALWHMFPNPVYGDPTNREEDFSDLAIRLAQRGMRWVKLALAHGITMANRRIRSESRAFYGYGINRPGNTPKLPPQHDEYDQARNDYLRNLMEIIREVDEANRFLPHE